MIICSVLDQVRGRWGARDERGSGHALEAVLIIPVVVLLGVLVIAGARIAMADTTVGSTAGAAARAASLARNAPDADREARSVAAASLTNGGLQCAPATVSTSTAGFATPLGQPATVTVTVTCVVPLSDLALPGLGGNHTLTATQTSALDRYRTR